MKVPEMARQHGGQDLALGMQDEAARIEVISD